MTHIHRPETMSSLAPILLLVPGAVHEHVAIHSFGGLEHDRAQYEGLGFNVVRQNNYVMFLRHELKPNLRLEIIPRDRPEHDAWAVQTHDEFRDFENLLSRGDFDELEEESDDTPELKYKLFHHKVTGDVIQIIWRQTPVFKNVFDRALASA